MKRSQAPSRRGRWASPGSGGRDYAANERRGPRRPPSIIGGLVFLVEVLLAAGIVAPHLPTRDAPSSASPPTGNTDSDRDGLPDGAERSGWSTPRGTFRTDPGDPDTDGDGLLDGDEAGSAEDRSERRYEGYSDPLSRDTDGDGLSDSQEADLGIDPDDPDVDGDGLLDGREVNTLGTAPDLGDTDADGIDDRQEVTGANEAGVDALSPDRKTSRAQYASQFAAGAVLGELKPEDSLAWLMGNLTAGASSLIPVVGWLVGGAADLRDVVGSAIHQDWVGSGFSAAGIIPDVGDAVAVPTKLAKFVARNPTLAAPAAAAVVSLPRLPTVLKVRAAKGVYPSWDRLRRAGASDRALLRLAAGRTELEDLASAMARSSHVDGTRAPFSRSWREGESWLAESLGQTSKQIDTQVRFSTRGCRDGCSSPARFVDVLADGVAHEAKVGHVPWSPFVERQIAKDAFLAEHETSYRAHWDFLPSERSNTVGASKRVFDALERAGIPYTVHLPK